MILKSYTYLLFFLFLGAAPTLNAQNFIDSLKQELQKSPHDTIALAHYFDIGNEYWLMHEDSVDLAEEYTLKSIEISHSLKDYSWEASGYNLLGKIYDLMGKLDESIEAFESAMEYAQKEGNTMRWHMYLDNRANILVYKGEFVEGLEAKQKALTYFEENSDSITIASTLFGIGYLYQGKREYLNSIPYYHKAKLYAPEWELLHSEIFGNFAIMYRELEEIDSSQYYFKEAALLGKEVPGIYAVNMHEYALLYEKIGELDSALYHIDNVLALDGQDKLGEHYNLFKISRARILASKKRGQEAVRLFVQAEPQLKGTSNLQNQAALYKTGHQVFKEVGDYEQAMEYHMLYSNVMDTLDNIEKERNFQDIETKYETEKKVQEIAQLQVADEFNKSLLSGQRYLIFGLVIGLGGLAYFLRRIFVQKREIGNQKTELGKALEDKNILLKEIHHRVKNNLQVVSSLLFLQTRYIEDQSALEAIKTGRTRVQSMSLLHQKLYQRDNLKSVRMSEYFGELTTNLFDTYNLTGKEIKLVTDIDNIDLDVDVVVPLGLITNELISNALKHAFNGQENATITLSLKKDFDELVLKVSDNGKGISLDKIPEKSSSLGLQLIKSFSDKLKADLQIENKEGTTFILRFTPKIKLKTAV